MRPRSRLWWTIYGACAVSVLAALAWISRIALDLERSEAEARVEVGHEQLVREALWRMDSWLAPILAAESARNVEEYTPIRYAGALGAFATSELLEFRSRHISQHFELVEGEAGCLDARMNPYRKRRVGSEPLVPVRGESRTANEPE